MSKLPNIDVKSLAGMAQKAVQSVDTKKMKEGISQGAQKVTEKAGELKDAAVKAKDDVSDKLTELDRQLDEGITRYNDAFTLMNDKGMQLYIQRSRAVDSISFVQNLVNSIANRPKSFDTDMEEVAVSRNKFTDSCEFADRELQAARIAAGGAGAGLAAGASVAFMGPTAAMWIATTFGTASTGAAISTLSGAAATNAALAWLGGGAVAAGGGGVMAGHALLALAGPIGWTIAGASLLSSIVLFTKKKMKTNKEKSEEIEAVKENTEKVKEMDKKIGAMLTDFSQIRTRLNESYAEALSMYNGDYTSFSDDQKRQLGALANNTKKLSLLMGTTIE